MKQQATVIIKYLSLRRRMINEPYYYTEKQVSHTVWKLLKMDSEILEAFIDWFKEDKIPNLKYGEISWKDLTSKLHFNEFNAFIFMNHVKHNPEVAAFDLQQGKGRSLSLKVEELRPELQEYVKEQQKKEEEKAKQEGRVFNDTDEIKVTKGESFTVMLNNK